MCLWYLTVLCLATLLRCLKHRTCSKGRSTCKGRNAGSGHWLGTLGRNSKTPVEPGQELLQHGPGLLKCGCSREPQFRDQPVLEGSGRPLDSALGLGRQGEYHLNPQFLHCPSELGGRAGGLIFRLVLEDRVPVGVQGEGNAEAPEQALHQPEVAAGPSHPPRPYPGDERRQLPPPPQPAERRLPGLGRAGRLLTQSGPADPCSWPDPARLPIQSFLIVPVVHDSSAAVVHLLAALDRPIHP